MYAIRSYYVLNRIENVETANNGQYQNWPVEDVIIEKVTIQEY